MKLFTYKDIEENVSELNIIKGKRESILFNKASPILEAEKNTICWLSKSNRNYIDILNNSLANLVICSLELDYENYNNENCILLLVENPKLTYVNILRQLFIEVSDFKIHPTAIIDPGAEIATNVAIGAFSVIEKVKIGEYTIIENSCHIKQNTSIGTNVLIKSNSVIGGDGFGYVTDSNLNNLKFPHLGGTIIKDFVDIGSNTCIDRGTLGHTIIESYTKIDNLVHIAHNVRIGKNGLVIANSVVGGSTIIGDNVWIAPNVVIRDNLTLGANVTIGMGAVVTKNIPDSETWIGNPAKKINK